MDSKKMNNYNDILLPHHVSQKHPADVKARLCGTVSPFSALTGYDGIIDENGRLTAERRE